MFAKGMYESLGYKEFWKDNATYFKHRDPSCATISQISCLMGLIKNFRFCDGTGIQRVLEIGVSTGMTSYYMLKSGANNETSFKLYGIDKNQGEYYGKVVFQEAASNELKHWDFAPGKTAFDIDDVLKDDEPLDMVFIDGAHAHPYPLIDLILTMPHAREDALFVLHDVENYPVAGEQGNSYLYTAWKGEKYLNWNIDNPDMNPTVTEYMGVVRLPKDVEILHNMLILLARQPIDAPEFLYETEDNRHIGRYLGIGLEDVEGKLRHYMEQYYEAKFTSSFIATLAESLRQYQEHEVYLHHQTRLFNKYMDEIQQVRYSLDIFARYIFPWAVVKPQSHIILYGAGKVGKAYLRQLLRTKYCTVDMVCDIDESKLQGLPVPACTVDELAANVHGDGTNYPIVIVAIESKELARKICGDLEKRGIPSEFLRWAPPIRQTD